MNSKCGRQRITAFIRANRRWAKVRKPAAYSSDESALAFSVKPSCDRRMATETQSLFEIGDEVLIDGSRHVIGDKADEIAGEKKRERQMAC